MLELREVARPQWNGIDSAGLECYQTRCPKTNRNVNDRICIDAVLAEQQANRKLLSIAAACNADFFADQIL